MIGSALVGASLTACGEPATDRERVRLRFDYAEGDTLWYVYHAAGTATMPDSGDADRVRTRSYERTLEIEEIASDVTPGGNYVLDLIYRIEPDTLHPEMPERVDLQLEITAQGRIVDVSGVETARPLYGDIDFQSYFEQSQPVFPERPLASGDSWTQEVKVVSPGGAEPVVTSSTYVLEEIGRESGRPVAIIRFDGDIFLPVMAPRSSASPSDGDREAMEERIVVRGTIHFDHAAGLVRRIETTAEATLTRIAYTAGEPTRREITIDETSELRLLRRAGPSAGR